MKDENYLTSPADTCHHNPARHLQFLQHLPHQQVVSLCTVRCLQLQQVHQLAACMKENVRPAVPISSNQVSSANVAEFTGMGRRPCTAWPETESLVCVVCLSNDPRKK